MRSRTSSKGLLRHREQAIKRPREGSSRSELPFSPFSSPSPRIVGHETRPLHYDLGSCGGGRAEERLRDSAFRPHATSNIFILPRGVVDEGVLEEGEEDEGDAEVGPNVDGLGVRHRRQRVVDRGRRRRHRQQRGHRQRHPGRSLYGKRKDDKSRMVTNPG